VRRCVGIGVVLSAGLVTSLMAANVWESKPFHTWTDKELAKVLSDSPWAGKGTISYVQNRSGQPPIRETALVTWASARVMRQALVREAFGVTTTVPDETAGVLASTPPLLHGHREARGCSQVSRSCSVYIRDAERNVPRRARETADSGDAGHGTGGGCRWPPQRRARRWA
jgi:hypothetical protein